MYKSVLGKNKQITKQKEDKHESRIQFQTYPLTDAWPM
jgi:hypothetical protein